MLDIKFIRENQETVKTALKNRGARFELDYFLELDEKRRGKIKEVDDLRAEQNAASDQIAKLSGKEREEKIGESKKLKNQLGDVEFELKAMEEEFQTLLFQIPNIPEPDVPVGGEDDKKIIHEWGEKPKFDFNPRNYLEIAQKIDLIDTERAAKVSGTRFGYLKNEAVLLEMALAQFAFSRLQKKGFIPIIPPVLIRPEMMRAMGYIDSEAEREERYFLEKDKLYLVGTSEQSIGPMHQGETLDENKLPLRYAAFSTCFRREAGSYGKDTKGILRVHQFDKVEMFILSLPENSKKEHQLMLGIEEELMQELKLSYRVAHLASADTGAPSASTFDIEAWLPGQNEGQGEYRETHSTSNTTDFQARRLNLKIRRAEGKTEFAHLLNGTAFAIGRMIIAIIETYQQEDGSVKVPEALQGYMGGMKVIK